MNLDELRSVQSTERQKDSLQNLRPSFYQEVGEYVAGLEDERDRAAERAEDPFSSPEVSRLTDEIETARDVVEAIYERRMGKLVKQASLAAAGMSADDEGLTAEETALFEDLVERIESNKTRVLDVLEGGDPAAEADDGRDAAEPSREPSVEHDAPPAPPEEPPADVERGSDDGADSSGVSAADVMGGSVEPSTDDAPPGSTDDGDGPATDDRSAADSAGDEDGSAAAGESGAGDASSGEGDDVDRMTVRITRDVGAILGVDDREYALSADDVVTLPEQNAEPLVEREAAEPLE